MLKLDLSMLEGVVSQEQIQAMAPEVVLQARTISYVNIFKQWI